MTWGILLVLLVAIAYLFISESGKWLVRDDDFGHLRWVVVLDGQSGDLERSDFAAELIQSGRVDSVLLLGRRVFRDRNNADFYAEDIVEVGGVDPERVYVFRHDDPSTLEEAVTIIPWLKRRALRDTVLLLTSAPATRRAAFIFNKLSGGHPHFVTADLHNWRYNADGWIFERESRKSWFREWAAFLVAKWELLGVDTLTTESRRMRAPVSWASVSESPRVKAEPVEAKSLLSIREAIAKQDSALEASRQTGKDSLNFSSEKKEPPKE